MARLPQGLPAKIVQRDAECTQRVDDGTAGAVHRRAGIQPIPEALDVEGVGAQEHVP